ncbi:MAG TPA: hypothetical protein PLG21_13365 [Anaerolineae bacterium]|nr:hypothetical protein [Anaerolineae bacterium]
MRGRLGRALAAVGLLALGVVLVGCTGGPPAADLALRPAEISPNADGSSDVTQISYRLSRAAAVSLYFVDENGGRHYFRQDSRRAYSADPYQVDFGGAIDGRLLPDGRYTAVLEATDDRGQTAHLEAPLTISGGDPAPLTIENLSISPNLFTPNRNVISDRVTIGYYLSKDVRQVEAYLLDKDGLRYPIPQDKIRKAGAKGSHQHDYDAGVDLGAQPPDDGVYTVVVEAEDYVGNKDRVTGPLTIVSGGVPQVEIVNAAAEWSAPIVSLGDTLTFTCTVRNIGTVPVRTKGPEPGTLYGMDDNFNAFKQPEEPGLFRVGLDYEGNSAGRQYPFRWQLGRDDELTEINGQKYLMPGQTVTVTGRVKIDEKTVRVEPYFWIGLIHENVWIVQDRVEYTQIKVQF